MENPASSLWSHSVAQGLACAWARVHAAWVGTGEQRRGPTPTHLLLSTQLEAHGHRHRTHPPPSPVVNTKGPRCPQKCPHNQRTVTHPFASGEGISPGSGLPGPRAEIRPGGGKGVRPAHRGYPTRPSGHAVPFRRSQFLGSPRLLLLEPDPVLGLSRGAGGRRSPSRPALQEAARPEMGASGKSTSARGDLTARPQAASVPKPSRPAAPRCQ